MTDERAIELYLYIQERKDMLEFNLRDRGRE